MKVYKIPEATVMRLSIYSRYLHQLMGEGAVSYTHLRAHETVLDLVCRLLLEKKKKNIKIKTALLPKKQPYNHKLNIDMKNKN